jgi:hypothetical protein
MSAAGVSPQACFAAALLDHDRPLPEGLTAWNRSDPSRRFAVYRNNVASSLANALAAKFPVTRELVGAEFFAAMAVVHARQAPPRSRRLAEFGEDFPAFIAAFEPAEGLPYLPDVARLEACRLAVYHAADRTALEPDAFALHAEGDLASLRFDFAPSAEVLRSDFAVFSLFAAHRGDLSIGDVDPFQRQCVLIARRGEDVSVTLIEPTFALFLTMLMRGASLGEAAGGAMIRDPAFDLSTALASLIAGRLVFRIHSQQGPHA